MTALILPPDVKPPRRIQIPTEPILKLGDGRLLRASGRPVTLRDGKGVYMQGQWYEGPKRLSVCATMDETPRWGLLLHVSLAYPNHDPSWTDIKLVRAAFYPDDIDVAMMLPKAADYIAGSPLHPDSHCFQMWQCPTEWGLR